MTARCCLGGTIRSSRRRQTRWSPEGWRPWFSASLVVVGVLTNCYRFSLDAAEFLHRFAAADETVLTTVAVTGSGEVVAAGTTLKAAAVASAFPGVVRLGAGLAPSLAPNAGSSTTPASSDAFLIRLSGDGQIRGAVIWGGSAPDQAQLVRVAPSGEVIVVGSTQSEDFPMGATRASFATNPPAAGQRSMFVARFDPSGTNLLATQFFKATEPTALAVDGHGDVVFAVLTSSPEDFTPGEVAFTADASVWSAVGKLAADGSGLAYWQWLGRGPGAGRVEGLALDASGDAYVTGVTAGNGVPITNALQSVRPALNRAAAFLTHIDASGRLIFSTYLAGELADDGQAVALTSAGGVLVAGLTWSTHLPAGLLDWRSGGRTSERMFVAEFDGLGQILVRSNIFVDGLAGPLRGPVTLADGRKLLAGRGADRFTGPVFATVEGERGRTFFDPLRRRQNMELQEMVGGPGDSIYAVGSEQVGSDPNGSFLARYRSTDFPSTKPAEVRLVQPQAELRYPVHGTIPVQAQLAGITGEVRSVTFRAGRRILGLVTNAPYWLNWSNATRGVHVLSATADVDGRQVKSPSVVVTVASPVNDNFARRLRVSGASVDIAGDMSGSTAEVGEPYPYQSSVWYAWSPPADGVYEIRLDTPSPSMPWLLQAGIYAGSKLERLTATQVGLLLSGQAMAFPARRGENLNLRVGASASGPSRLKFRLRLRPVVAPVNDNLAEATVVIGANVEAVAFLQNATTEASEPFTAGSVWYRWTAPNSGEYLLSSEQTVSMNAFVGSAMSELVAVSMPVAGVTNGAVFAAEEGTTYRIGLSGSAQAEVSWRLQPVQAPANDRLFAATPIPPGIRSVPGSLLGAHYETEIGGNRPWAPNVWWTWRPESTGRYLVNVRPVTTVTETTGPNPVRTIPSRSDLVAVYRLDGLGGLQSISTNQNAYGPDLVDVEGGTEYAIAVSGYLSWFALELIPVRAPTNDRWDEAWRMDGLVADADGLLEWATLEPGEPVSTSPFPSPPLPGNGSASRETVPQPAAREASFHAAVGVPGPGPGYGTTRRSVWYRWVAPTNGDFVLTISGAFGRVFTGDGVRSLTAVSSNSYEPRFTAVANEQYHLQISDSSQLGAGDFTLRLRPAFSPANDAFAGRESLAGVPVSFVPDVLDASIEPGEPSASGTGRGSIWYSWTAPSSGSWRLEWNFTVPGVYVGDALTNLESIPVYRGPSGYEFAAVTGTNYTLALDAGAFAGMTPGYVPAVSLRPNAAPTNDTFATRIPLRGRTVAVIGSNVGATREPDEPQFDLNASGRTVWWSWRAPENGFVAISPPAALPGSSYFGGTLGVFAGDALSTLSNLTSMSLHLPVQAGQEYQIVVDSPTYFSSGEFSLGIAYHPALANDDFEDRRPCDGSVAGTLLGATFELDEPSPGLALTPSAWWTWTPKRSGVYELSLAAWDGRDGPSVLVAADLFTGEFLSSLESVARIHLGNPLLPNPVRVRLEAGTAYSLRISGNPIDTRFRFRATYQTPPRNDRFEDRIVLRGTNIVVAGSVATASAGQDDSGEPNAWWTWIAPFTGAAHGELRRSSLYDCPELRVFTGSSAEELERIVDPASAVTLPVTAGQRYEIAVSSGACGGPGAPFELEWTLHRPPANDAFTNRLSVAGMNVVVPDVTLWGATLEPGDPAAGFGADASLWWKWIVPATGRYTFSGVTALYGVDSLGGRTLVATNPPSLDALNVSLEAGTELAVLLAGDISLAPRRTTWSLRAVASPANDTFANRAPISGPRASGTLEGATADPEATGPLGSADPTIWWSLRVTNSGWRRIVLETPNSARAALRIFGGTSLDSLELLTPIYEAPFGAVFYHLRAEVDYALAVSGRDGWFGPVEVSIRDVATAANDWFANAVEVTGSDVTMSADNRLCTLEDGEPPRPLTRGVNSVWWRWTPSSSGVFSITRSNSPAFALVDVYTGTSISDLTRVPETAYGRDFGEYLFRAEAGTTYSISGTTTDFGHGIIRMRLLAAHPPANDDFDQRTTLVGSSASVTASNLDATAEPGDPVAGALGEQTLWWRWTAPVSGLVTIAKPRVDSAIRVGVFTGTTLNTLTPVAAPTLTWPVIFSATEGTEYAIGVTPWSAYNLPLDFTIDLRPAGPARAAAPADVTGSRPEPSRKSLILGAPDSARSWVIESSADLQQWTAVTTNAAGTASVALPVAPGDPVRFFRTRAR